jgi:hypothetical protein
MLISEITDKIHQFKVKSKNLKKINYFEVQQIQINSKCLKTSKFVISMKN